MLPARCIGLQRIFVKATRCHSFVLLVGQPLCEGHAQGALGLCAARLLLTQPLPSPRLEWLLPAGTTAIFLILALALIVIPVVIRTTENMLTLIPNALREAAYALGTPKWKVIMLITLRAARAGVVTGVLLAVARISGETAPLLFTALSNQFWSADMSAPMASLPVTIFKFAMSPYENWQKLAWAGVFLITLGVLALNIIARVLFRQR